MESISLRVGFVLAVLAALGIGVAASTKSDSVVKLIPNFTSEVFRSTEDSSSRSRINLDGSEEYTGAPAIAGQRPLDYALDDSIGSAYLAGTTYYELQHNSTAGRTIGVDADGIVHVVWTNGLDDGISQRQVFYNWFDPTLSAFNFYGGVSISGSPRSGFVSLVVERNGWAFPAFHERSDIDPNQHATAGIDFQQGSGAFTMTEPAWLYGNSGSQIIWPKIAIGRDSVLHMVSTNSVGFPQAFYYSRGLTQWSGGNGSSIAWQTVEVVGGQPEQLLFVDSVGGVNANIAASPVSGRVVMVWSRPDRDQLTGEVLAEVNDLFIEISEDNGLNWGEPVNVTNFCGPDAACESGNWQGCNGDTLRVWNENSVLIDNSDNIHIAFTAVPYHYWNQFGQYGHQTSDPKSAIWYWNSGTSDFSPVATEFGETSIPGGWTTAGTLYRAVCKPSIAIDDATGDLFCSYRRAMPDQWSANYFPMGDICVSKSADDGATWGQGRNVTQTDGGQYTAAPASLSERDPVLSERVTTRAGTKYLHLLYELDHDAGTFLQGEGVATLNEIFYLAIPADSIPATPTVPWAPIHVAPVLGACCYTNGTNQIVCGQTTYCDCQALGGDYHGAGSASCAPANDQCPGTVIWSLPYSVSGNTCCAAPDYTGCGSTGKDVFFYLTLPCTTIARISLCDSPDSWDSHVSIYHAGEFGSCTDEFLVGCLDDGCVDPNHANQSFTFNANEMYFLALSGVTTEDCGRYVLNVTADSSAYYPHYPQPDTLVYDDNIPTAYYLADVWLRMRFTAPTNFDLQSVYVNTIYGTGGCAEQCSAYVYTDTPQPGGEVAAGRSYVGGFTVSNPLIWSDVLLNDTVAVSAGSDFWIAVGPAQPGLSWKLLLSSAVPEARTEISLDGLHGVYDQSLYEAFIRAGGELQIGAPDSLVIRRADNSSDIHLNWSVVPGADEYNVYRSTSPDVQAIPANWIGSSPLNAYVDSGVLLDPNVEHFYVVTAFHTVARADDSLAPKAEFSSSVSH